MRSLLVILIIFCGTALASEINKRQGADGSVEYSDIPGEGSEKLSLPPVNTVAPETPSQGTPYSDNSPPPLREDRYSAVRITSPVNDEVIHDNEGRIVVQVVFEPEFHAVYGHQILVLIDGAIIGRFSSPNNIVIEGLDRGSHTLTVQVVDLNGAAVASSQTITVHIKRHSILHPKPVQ